ncbi:MAG TPA: acyltransferase family protein, partial [Methyloceanibacter sp.]|nr:acyltransferase family protein [Methyloceanibacter sp.]
MRYRPDIDGLRAIAIATVVLFHLGINAVPGGFVGVDIFFVISGYLITRLIVEQLRQGRFSFWDFYARRTRRIYPALFVLIPVVLLVGYFVLTPGEYQDLGRSAIFSSAFLANVYFWLNTGYFDQAAATMPLLHLWSIGVEEQFYIIWPMTLVLVWRFARMGQNATLMALVAATVLLAILCIVWTGFDSKSAFYLPFTRLWEFTLGALVLALPAIARPRLSDVLSVLGVAAMIAAALTLNENLPYPGYYAILPCAGAAACMAAGETSLMGRFLSLGPNVMLGKLSYSLYLWHWPIFVYYGLYVGNDVPVYDKLWLIPLALGISYLSWRFVEQPIRHRKDHPRQHVMIGASVAATTACVALAVVANGGFPSRIPESVRVLGDREAMMQFDCTEQIKLPELGRGKRCVVGAPWGSASKHAVLWGDSHARHILPILNLPAREQDLSILYWAGCPPFIDNDAVQRNNPGRADYSENCAQLRRQILDWLPKAPNIDLVIIADAWAIYPESLYVGGVFDENDPAEALDRMERGLAQTLAEIDPKRHSVLFIGDMPRPEFNVPSCALHTVSGLWRKPCRKYREFFTDKARPSEAILKRLADGSDNVYFHDSLTAMCAGPKGCTIRIGDEIVYRDTNHFRHDLSLATRQEIVSMLGLGEA